MRKTLRISSVLGTRFFTGYILEGTSLLTSHALISPPTITKTCCEVYTKIFTPSGFV